MKKFLSLFLLLLAVMGFGMTFTACSDDDGDKEAEEIKSSDLPCQDTDSLYCVGGKIVIPEVQIAEGSGKTIIEVAAAAEDGTAYTLKFRDLNGNGAVDPYEDWRLSVEDRTNDLLSKMTKEQKAGLLYESGFSGRISDGSLTDSVKEGMVTSQVRVALFRNPGAGYTAEQMTTYINDVQAYVESQPLGIPFVFCCDPSTGTGLNTAGAAYEKKNSMEPMGDWPYSLGLSSLSDAEVVKEIGDMHAEEYKACGFRMLLGPMCDPLGDPRWARSYDTFGTDPEKAGEFAKAYIQGLQQVDDGSGNALVPGIAATLKHFPGAGTNMGGMDSHREQGRYALFKGDNFDASKEAFKTAFEAGPLCVMPCYSIYMTNWNPTTRTFDTEFEEVGSSYEMTLMWDILREECGWDGMVTSDWGVLGGSAYGLLMSDFGVTTLAADTDLSDPSYTPPADLPDGVPAFADWTIEARSGWGGTTYVAVEHESYLIYKYLQAGGHQVGNGSYTMWLNAVDNNFLAESDLDYPAGKVLEMMFKLGVFENPYRDASVANAVRDANLDRAKEIMKETTVLVKNAGDVLPLSATSGTVYFDGIDDGVVDDFANTTTTDMTQADYIILRVTGRHGNYSGLAGGVPISFQANVYSYNYDEWRHYTEAENEASKDPADPEDIGDYVVNDSSRANSIAQADKIKAAIAAKKEGAKLILCVFAPRPFLFDADIDVTKIDALLVEFGIYDEQLLEVIYSTDGFEPSAVLPFCIPASDADVEAAYEDLYNDEANKLFDEGTSLSY